MSDLIECQKSDSEMSTRSSWSILNDEDGTDSDLSINSYDEVSETSDKFGCNVKVSKSASAILEKAPYGDDGDLYKDVMHSFSEDNIEIIDKTMCCAEKENEYRNIFDKYNRVGSGLDFDDDDDQSKIVKNAMRGRYVKPWRAYMFTLFGSILSLGCFFALFLMVPRAQPPTPFEPFVNNYQTNLQNCKDSIKVFDKFSILEQCCCCKNNIDESTNCTKQHPYGPWKEEDLPDKKLAETKYPNTQKDVKNVQTEDELKVAAKKEFRCIEPVVYAPDVPVPEAQLPIPEPPKVVLSDSQQEDVKKHLDTLRVIEAAISEDITQTRATENPLTPTNPHLENMKKLLAQENETAEKKPPVEKADAQKHEEVPKRRAAKRKCRVKKSRNVPETTKPKTQNAQKIESPKVLETQEPKRIENDNEPLFVISQYEMDLQLLIMIRDMLLLGWVYNTRRVANKETKRLKKQIKTVKREKRGREQDKLTNEQCIINYVNEVQKQPAKKHVIKKTTTQKLFDILPFKHAVFKKSSNKNLHKKSLEKLKNPKLTSRKRKLVKSINSVEELKIELNKRSKNNTKGKEYIGEIKKLRKEQQTFLENMKIEKLKLMQEIVKERKELQTTLKDIHNRYELQIHPGSLSKITPPLPKNSNYNNKKQISETVILKDDLMNERLSEYYKTKEEYFNRRSEISNLLRDRLLKKKELSKSECNLKGEPKNGTDLLDSMINVAIKKIKRKNNSCNNNLTETPSSTTATSNKKTDDIINIISCPEVHQLAKSVSSTSSQDNLKYALVERCHNFKQNTLYEWLFGKKSYEIKKKDNQVWYVRKEIIKQNLPLSKHDPKSLHIEKIVKPHN